jgi:PAS domain S-box-containing protein
MRETKATMAPAERTKAAKRQPETAEFRSRRTLYRDLVISIVLVVAVVFIAVASTSYFYLSHKAKVQSASTLAEFSEYLRNALELPVWNIDEEGIRKICETFFENALVAAIKVTDHEGLVYFEKQRADIGDALRSSREIRHKSTLVGYLEVALDTRFFTQQQRQFLWLCIVGLAAVSLVLALALRIVLKVLLISPLDQLIQRIDLISRGQYEFDALEAPQEEIRTISSKFNTMADRVKRRERSLKKVNLRLEQEIGRHRDAQSELLNSREELHSIIRSTPDIIYRLDTTGRFTFVSDAIRRYGIDPEDLLNRSFYDFVHEDDREAARSRLRRRGSGSAKRLIIRAFGEYCRSHQGGVQPSDPVFLVDAEGLYVSGESGMKVFVGAQGTARDITEQRQMETARRQSEDRLRLALDVSGAGIWQLDLKSGALLMDDRICDVLGYDPDQLKDGLALIRENTMPETWEVLKENYNRHIAGKAQMFDHEFSFKTCRGKWRWFHTKAKVVGLDKEGRPETMVGIVLDTSNRRDAEEEREQLVQKLQQAQKMEAIGTLAGGIAHDFNNILGAILGYAQLTQMQTAGDERVKGYVDNIFKASERAKGLVEQILIFTRQGKTKKIPGDIAIVLKEVVKLLRATIPATIEIVQKIPSNLGTVLADQTQIHQVMMNLCTNATHAMEERGGRLTVTLESADVRSKTGEGARDLQPGRYLKLAVGDTGTGMKKEIVDRIFDPYFTTKALGEGTGMGLATAHGIVNDHGGRIFVETRLGEGTVFNVFFPVQEDPAEATVGQAPAYSRGTERILFVDDEELLVEVGVEMLKDLGYEAVGATDPMQALEILTEKPDGFDLVITDMTMPGMTGDQLAAEVIHFQPAIPIIICTGFSKRLSVVRASSLNIRAFLMKPITVEELSQTIRDALDKPETALAAAL